MLTKSIVALDKLVAFLRYSITMVVKASSEALRYALASLGLVWLSSSLKHRQPRALTSSGICLGDKLQTLHLSCALPDAVSAVCIGESRSTISLLATDLLITNSDNNASF
jgi:hypothetical protein